MGCEPAAAQRNHADGRALIGLLYAEVSRAAVLCGIAWIIGADLLALYASFGDDSPYGAIGGLLVVMLWRKIVSLVLYYGAELCKVVAH